MVSFKDIEEINNHFIMTLIYLFQGGEPFFVNGTGGTTVFGAYDPLDKIADLCEKYDLWFHVDVSFSCYV